jgi:MoaA/NifB/PqqE/SkfB family radical SAM enzyme
MRKLTKNGVNFSSFQRRHGRLDPSTVFENTKRRLGWFLENLTLRKLINIIGDVMQFAGKSERMLAWPAVLKIDISPLCNLKCTVCVHASPNGNAALEKQTFHSSQKMSVDQFRHIVNEIKGKTSAVSLYYYGDPLVHPHLEEICRIARDAGLNVHISTNFSFALSDDRIKRIVQSGLTHLTVCVDGLSQEKYQLTRVGGRIERVLANLERVCRFRREYGQNYPRVEVQYIKFQHNVDEEEKARALFTAMGVDRVTSFWGWLDNYTDHNFGAYPVHSPKKRQRLPQCHWPHFSMLVRYNGQVVPCANYRMGEQQTSPEGSRVLGNVFETSVREVWNSPQYRAARRLVSNPELANKETALQEHFCYGCPAIFHTEREKHIRSGSDYTFEALYTLGDKGIPMRRPLSSDAAALST